VLVTLSAPVGSLPLAAFAPDQAPEAVQAVALVEDQVSVEDAPPATLVGSALKVRVGSGNTVTVRFLVAVPPGPAHESE
jgi:hypothetical protein